MDIPVSVNPQSKPEQMLHTVKQSMTILGGMSRATFYRRVAAGEIKTVRIGRRTLVSKKALLEFVESIGA